MTGDERLLKEAGELLIGARATTLDPGLRRSWGQRKRRLLDKLIDRGLLKEGDQ